MDYMHDILDVLLKHPYIESSLPIFVGLVILTAIFSFVSRVFFTSKLDTKLKGVERLLSIQEKLDNNTSLSSTNRSRLQRLMDGELDRLLDPPGDIFDLFSHVLQLPSPLSRLEGLCRLIFSIGTFIFGIVSLIFCCGLIYLSIALVVGGLGFWWYAGDWTVALYGAVGWLWGIMLLYLLEPRIWAMGSWSTSQWEYVREKVLK